MPKGSSPPLCCPDCGVVRDPSNTYPYGARKDGTPHYTTRCKACHRAERSEYLKEYKRKRRRQAGVVPLEERQPQTHCKYGHIKDSRQSGGRLRCSTCHRDQQRKRNHARGATPRQLRTHCPQGHELTPENIRGGKKGRACALCHRLRERRVFDPTAKRFAAVIVRDPCVYCGKPGGTVDHIKPIAKGGTDDWWNLAGACHSCNARKRTTDLLQFLLRRQETRAQARP